MGCNSFWRQALAGLAQGSRDTEAAHGQNKLTPTTGKGSAGPPKNAAPAGKGGGQGHRPTGDYDHAYPPILSNKDELGEREATPCRRERNLQGKGRGVCKDKGAEATKG